uniref:Nose resistant-to-fluoxetine protein N-terminal domain-containing protein n=1 Tax=Megaselia scalaris TaxID=36166 RepID=T1GEG6_MEGSC
MSEILIQISNLASSAYDSSGHFRGQILYGNNKWLGQKRFCQEISTNTSLKFAYSISSISVNITNVIKYSSILEIGECLPNVCSSKDINLILKADPQSNYISSLQLTQTFSILEVRTRETVKKWIDYRFKIFVSLTIFVFILVNLATIYVAFKENNELKPKTTNLEMQSTKDESNVVAGSKIKETVSKKSSKTFLIL